MEYEIDRVPSIDELLPLYDSVGWSAYTSAPDDLATAVQNSTYLVTARVDGRLVGLARVLSDDVSIVYVQDVLVDPRHQRTGVGKHLLELCLERFAHVRQRMLLTDDEPHQHRLYKALGFHDVCEVGGVGLHAFVDIVGADLTSLDPSDS